MTRLDLDIDLTAGPGRPAAPLHATYVRDLREDDIAAMKQNRGSKPPELKRISDRHHALARLLAAGTPEAEAALATGYGVSRVSILKQSPAFQELVALYRKEVDFQFSTILEHMAGLSHDAILEIRERLEESPEDFSNKDLLSLVNDMADRTGAPRQKEVNNNVTFNLGDRLERARARAREAINAQIEDAEIIEDSE